MPDRAAKFGWVSRLGLWATIASLGLLALGLVHAVALLVMSALHWTDWTTFARWVLLVLGLGVVAIWVVVLYGVVRLISSNEYGVGNAAARLGRVEPLLEDLSGSGKKLVELSCMSDQAKSLLYRDMELEVIRETFREDVMRQNYETAERLIESIESNLGYADEAGRLREELAQSKQRSLEEKVDAAVARVEKYIENGEWQRAIRQAQRLGRLFPDHEKIARLPERISRARVEHKRRLLEDYRTAVQNNDVDRGIELLRRLDVYLTPQEASALAESARGVFKAKLNNLGVQFSIYVNDQQWPKALDTGQDIIRQFPNSRMAQEVREKLDLLKARAAETE